MGNNNSTQIQAVPAARVLKRFPAETKTDFHARCLAVQQFLKDTKTSTRGLQPNHFYANYSGTLNGTASLKTLDTSSVCYMDSRVLIGKNESEVGVSYEISMPIL